jgi:hypothetical protein
VEGREGERALGYGAKHEEGRDRAHPRPRGTKNVAMTFPRSPILLSRTTGNEIGSDAIFEAFALAAELLVGALSAPVRSPADPPES